MFLKDPFNLTILADITSQVVLQFRVHQVTDPNIVSPPLQLSHKIRADEAATTRN
jgi:hypothetical protein